MTPSLCIRCVPFQIERVLDNFLSNAVAAVPDEGGEVSIRTWQHDGWAIMEIANTAHVSKDELEWHLRGEEGARRGLGLHICERLIRNMGGEIDVEARDGLAIFQVRLPILR